MIDEVKVRIGTPSDVHPFMDLVMACTRENALIHPDPEKILGEVWAALNRDHGIVGIIGEEDGAPLEAGILLRVSEMWYSKDSVVDERGLFVRPDFRSAKGGRASRLCEFAKNVQRTLEMPLVIGVLSTSRADAKVRLYERQFGPASGGYWIVGAKTGAQQEAAE